jgi:serine/threonine-protein phosphatase 2A activator
MTSLPPTKKIIRGLNDPATLAARATTSSSSSSAATTNSEQLLQAVKAVAGTPQKCVRLPHDIQHFYASEAYHDVVGFILRANAAMSGKTLSTARATAAAHYAAAAAKDGAAGDAASEPKQQQPTLRITAFLVQLKALVADVPPMKQAMRFGNRAFVTWLDRAREAADVFHRQFVPVSSSSSSVSSSSSEAADEAAASDDSARVELTAYFMASFGNVTRIDYGTGHELSFVWWLTALHKQGLLSPLPTSSSEMSAEDEAPVLMSCVADVFAAYLDLVRCLQLTYVLEPAGSKGVWGLDDYQFLPFLWGAAQLMRRRDTTTTTATTTDAADSAGGDGSADAVIDVTAVLDLAAVDRLAGEYLYFGAVQFIHQVRQHALFCCVCARTQLLTIFILASFCNSLSVQFRLSLLQVKTGPFHEHSPILTSITQLSGWPKANQGLIKMYHGEVMSKFPVMQHCLFASIMRWQKDENASAKAAKAPGAEFTQMNGGGGPGGGGGGGMRRPPMGGVKPPVINVTSRHAAQSTQTFKTE